MGTITDLGADSQLTELIGTAIKSAAIPAGAPQGIEEVVEPRNLYLTPETIALAERCIELNPDIDILLNHD
jgi:hypothetical protein